MDHQHGDHGNENADESLRLDTGTEDHDHILAENSRELHSGGAPDMLCGIGQHNAQRNGAQNDIDVLCILAEDGADQKAFNDHTDQEHDHHCGDQRQCKRPMQVSVKRQADKSTEHQQFPLTEGHQTRGGINQAIAQCDQTINASDNQRIDGQ